MSVFKETEYGTDKELVDDVVNGFYMCCESALSQSRGDVTGMDGITSAQAQQHAREAWVMLREARVFSIHPKKYGQTVRAIVRAWTDETWRANVPSGEVRAYMNDAAMRVPFPDKLPFPSVFIGFGTRMAFVPDEDTQIATNGRFRDTEKSLRDELGDVKIGVMGFVVGSVGDSPSAFAFMLARGGKLKKPTVLINRVFSEEAKWWQGMTYDPWLLNILVTYINSHRTYVTKRPASGNIRYDRSKFQRGLKHALPLPEPFYVVHIDDNMIDRTGKRMIAHRTIEWTHRWDVRGHEVIRIVKGKRPVPAKERASLEKRGYKIHEWMDATHPDWKDLDTRKINVAEDEWVAVLRTWRKPHVKGPSDRPYVPALRVPMKPATL